MVPFVRLNKTLQLGITIQIMAHNADGENIGAKRSHQCTDTTQLKNNLFIEVGKNLKNPFHRNKGLELHSCSKATFPEGHLEYQNVYGNIFKRHQQGQDQAKGSEVMAQLPCLHDILGL